MQPWKTLDRLTHVALAFCLMVLVSACAAGKGKDGDGKEEIRAGCTDDTEDMFLRCPNDVVVEPGQSLILEVERVPVQVDELFLFLIDVDSDVAFKVPVKLPIEGEEATTWRLEVPLPPLPAGVWRGAVGPISGVASNPVGFEVYYPEPTITREEAREAYQAGMLGVTGIVDQLLSFDDPDWQRFMEDVLPPAQRDHLDGMISLLQDLTEEGVVLYDELGPEQELMVRSYLENTGFLSVMEGIAENPDWIIDVQRPVWLGTSTPILQILLFMTDLTGMIIETLGLITGVLTYASVVPGVGTAIGSFGFATDVILAVIKLIIDTFIPCDLVGFELHSSTWSPNLAHANVPMYEGEPVAAIYWGRFEPQNGASDAFTGLDGLIATVIAELLPIEGFEEPAKAAIEAGRDILANWNSSVLLKIADYGLVDTSTPLVGPIYTPVDIGMYTPDGITSTLLKQIPRKAEDADTNYGSFYVTKYISALLSSIADPPLSFVSSYPPQARDNAEIGFNNPYLLKIDGVTYPGSAPTDFAILDFTMQGWRFRSKDITVFGVKVATSPLLTRVAGAESVRIQPMADPTNPNQLQADEAYVHSDLPGFPVDSIVGVSTLSTTSRTYPVALTNAGGFADANAMFRIKVNGVTEVDLAVLPFGIETRYDIDFAPGRNKLTVEAISQPSGPCTTGQNATGSGCLVIGFPAARNADNATTVAFGSLPQLQRDFPVFVPPVPQ